MGRAEMSANDPKRTCLRTEQRLRAASSINPKVDATTRRIPVGRPLSPLPVQLTVERGLHRGGSGGRCLGRGSRMVENRRAPRGDGKTQLIERKGERHPHRLVELLAFALMHDRNDKIVSFD